MTRPLLASLCALCALCLLACGGGKPVARQDEQPTGPDFSADSALAFCQAQCDFGPRVMNSAAHDRCAAWIADAFGRYGCEVQLQHATLRGYDGTPLRATNIIATRRSADTAAAGPRPHLLVCAHYDSRPWADNDPDPANHRSPVMAANDGASGVAVMLELARLLQQADSARADVTFVCFDAEDWGTPQWADSDDGTDTWALGAQHWARTYAAAADSAAANGGGTTADSFDYGILLDMVGGQGATFYQEAHSLHYAPAVVRRVWQAAAAVGYSGMFPTEQGGMVTDDHVPVNQLAGIPCIDIVPCYPDCEASSFGPTWHTLSDDMQHLDKTTLKAVGQTLVQLIY